MSVTKLVMYKTCSPVMYQLRVHTAGASFKNVISCSKVGGSM